MSNVIHYYYPSPTLHHHPKFGRIRIGNIISDITKPEVVLARGAAIPPPPEGASTDDVKDIVEFGRPKGGPVAAKKPPVEAGEAAKPQEPADEVEASAATKEPKEMELSDETTISYQKTSEINTAQLRAGKVGVWAKVFSIGGASVGLEWTKKHDEVYRFEKMVTVEFWPSDEYITACVSKEKIKRILDLTNYKPLYLITGIKTVSGAKASTEDSSSRDVNASVEVDTTAASNGAVPVKGGPRFEHKKEDKMGQSFEESSDFVFAFKLKKITVNKKTKAVHAVDATKHALLSTDSTSSSLPFMVESVVDALPVDLGFVGESDLVDHEDTTAGATNEEAME